MVTIVQCDNYSDCKGNQIIGKIDGCKVIIKGENSRLVINGVFKAYGGGSVIILEDNCDVELGEFFQLGCRSILFFRANSFVRIGEHASLGNYTKMYIRGKMVVRDHFCLREYGELRIHGEANIGSWNYYQHHVTIYVPLNSVFETGKDAGISWYSKVLAGSGHSTFDLKHRMKLEDLSIETKQHTKLGAHVWVGSGSTIYNDVSIGNGCVVTANSNVYSGYFDDCSLISGNPAKMIMKDVTWDRRPNLTYEEYEEYCASDIELIERPSFFDEYSDEGIIDNYYF